MNINKYTHPSAKYVNVVINSEYKSMKSNLLIPICALLFLACACGRFSNEDKKKDHDQRIISAAKQYTEIMYALGAAEDLVAVDVSSTYPPQTAKLPTIGYHMHLSAAGILSMKPTLFLHHGGKWSIGPEQVVRKLKRLKIPMKTFETKTTDIASTKKLIQEMGKYFGKEERADSLCLKLDADMKKALAHTKQYDDTVSVVAIHFGRATNMYLVEGKNSVAGQMIRWAGAEIVVDNLGMAPIVSPEIIAKANPDVILLTAFGYDRLGSKEAVIKQLPGVGLTNAAKTGRIYRVEAHDLIYYGPRTGENVLKLQKLLQPDD